MGMKVTEVAEKYPAELDGFRHHPDKYDPSKIEGESFEELFERMTPKQFFRLGKALFFS